MVLLRSGDTGISTIRLVILTLNPPLKLYGSNKSVQLTKVNPIIKFLFELDIVKTKNRNYNHHCDNKGCHTLSHTKIVKSSNQITTLYQYTYLLGYR